MFFAKQIVRTIKWKLHVIKKNAILIYMFRMPWRNTMRIADLKEQISLITKLVKNDLKSRYSGSAFGMVWAYVQPLVTVLVFWYVFQVGFKKIGRASCRERV